MEIEFSIVYENNIPEHEPIFRKRKIYFSQIDSYQEHVENLGYTLIYLIGTEEVLTVNSPYHIVDAILMEKLEEKKNEERNKDLGI
jgi:hypothetical protein